MALLQCSGSVLTFRKNSVLHLQLSSSPYDVMPADFLKEVLETVGPCLLAIMNESLPSHFVRDHFNLATIQPFLKKPGLDPAICCHFRPISKLPFMSMILNSVFLKHIQDILEANKIFEKFPSGKLCYWHLLSVAGHRICCADSTNAVFTC